MIRRLLLRFKRVPPKKASPYFDWLVEQCHAFISERHPDKALPLDRFRSLLVGYMDTNEVKRANTYAGDLWYLFRPDFADDFDTYYRWQEMLLLATFLQYARDERFIIENYVRVLDAPFKEFGPFSMLEIGPGIPHGLLYRPFHGENPVSRYTFVDIDAIHPAFTEWLLRRMGVHVTRIIARAAEPFSIPGGPYDFIAGKDVFEHLHDPAHALRQILSAAGDHSILALDLEDRGTGRQGPQHIDVRLAKHKAILTEAGWTERELIGAVGIWERFLCRRPV